MEKNELKPCPFCGYEKIDIEKIDDIGTGLFMAICPRCSAKSGILENHKRVAEAWNRRVDNGR